jgi:hypothetical protein
MRISGHVVCAALIALAGCGGGPPPKLDTTSDESTAVSLKAMTDGMSDAEQKRFEEDCKIAALPGQYESPSSAPKGDGPKDKLRSLDGLTAAEIRARAAKLREGLSR